MDRELAAAVAARYHAVNGHHPMTAEDDAYASEWFEPVEEQAAVTSDGLDEVRRLQLANRLPLPGYLCRDGTQMVARDLLEPADEAGGFDELRAWFARPWE